MLGSLVQDSFGNLLGLCLMKSCPPDNYSQIGVVWMLAPSNGSWTFTVLRYGSQNFDSFYDLTVDAAGNLYGTGGNDRVYGCDSLAKLLSPKYA